MKDNIHYLYISKNNPEPSIDDNYIFVDYPSDINQYIEDIKLLKEYLITIKILKQNNDQNLYTYYNLLLNLLNGVNKSHYSEFMSFLNACDLSKESCKNISIDDLDKLISLFFEKRVNNCNFDMSLTPPQWIVAMIDKSSSRKKGVSGENKISSLLKANNYTPINNLDEIKNSKTKLLFGYFNENNININTINLAFNTKFNFDNSQNNERKKLLDLLIINKNKIFLLEAKHIKDSGGSQDKQILELKNIIKHPKEHDNIYTISFLDGLKSNSLLNNTKSFKEIEDILHQNKNSFWLNTTGLNALIQDIK